MATKKYNRGHDGFEMKVPGKQQNDGVGYKQPWKSTTLPIHRPMCETGDISLCTILELSTAKVKDIARNNINGSTIGYLPSKLTQHAFKPLRFCKTLNNAAKKSSAATRTRQITFGGRSATSSDSADQSCMISNAKNTWIRHHDTVGSYKPFKTETRLVPPHSSTCLPVDCNTPTDKPSLQHQASSNAGTSKSHRMPLTVSSIMLPVKIYDVTSNSYQSMVFPNRASRRKSAALQTTESTATVTGPKSVKFIENLTSFKTPIQSVKITPKTSSKSSETTTPKTTPRKDTPPTVPPLKLPSSNGVDPVGSDQYSVINFSFPLPPEHDADIRSSRTWNSSTKVDHNRVSPPSSSTVYRSPLTPPPARPSSVNYLSLPSVMEADSSFSSKMVSTPTFLFNPLNSTSTRLSSAKFTQTRSLNLPSSRISPHLTSGMIPSGVSISPKCISLSEVNPFPSCLSFVPSPSSAKLSVIRNNAFMAAPLSSRLMSCPISSPKPSPNRSFSGTIKAQKSPRLLPSPNSTTGLPNLTNKFLPTKMISGREIKTSERKKFTSNDSLFPCSFTVRKRMGGAVDEFYTARINPRSGLKPFDSSMPLSERMILRNSNNSAYYPVRFLGWPAANEPINYKQKQQKVLSNKNSWKQIRPTALSSRHHGNPPLGRRADSVDQSPVPRHVPALYNSAPSNLIIEGNRNPELQPPESPKYKYNNAFKLQNLAKMDTSFSSAQSFELLRPRNKNVLQRNLLTVSSAKMFEKVAELSPSKEYIKGELSFFAKRRASSCNDCTKRSKESYSYANMTDISPSLRKKIMQLQGHQCGTIRKEKKNINRRNSKAAYNKPKLVISC